MTFQHCRAGWALGVLWACRLCTGQQLLMFNWMTLKVMRRHCNSKGVISLKAKSDCYQFFKFYIYSSLVCNCEPCHVIIMELLRQQFANVLEALSNHVEWCHNQIHNALSFSDKVIIKGVLAWTERKSRAQTCSNVVSCDTNWAVPVFAFLLSPCFPLVCQGNASGFVLCHLLKQRSFRKEKNWKGLKFQSKASVLYLPTFSFNTVIGWHFREQIHRPEIFR